MPEGDTVWLAAKRLDAALAGRTLRRFELRVPRFATADLSGRQVTGVVARGKHLLTRIEGGVTLHSHPRMDGEWRLYPADRPGRGARLGWDDHGGRLDWDTRSDRDSRNDRGIRNGWNDLGDRNDRGTRNDRDSRNDRGIPNGWNDHGDRNDRGTRSDRDGRNDRGIRNGWNALGGRNGWGAQSGRGDRGDRGGRAAHQIRAVLANDAWAAVGYRVHDLALVETAREDTLVGHLGPDLLGPDWDPDEAVRRLAAQPDRPLGEALLDQRNLAGVGNIYKAEVLFLHRLNPWTRTGSATDLRAVADTAHRLLYANRDHPAQSTTGSLRRDEQHWVYGRAGRPCRRCGSAVQVADQGGAPNARITFWCPGCQPAAAPDPPRPS